MFDKSFYDGVFNFTLDYDKFYQDVKQLDQIKYDIEDSFDKYYSIELIEKALNMFVDKKINYAYFANWCNAYNWIINACYNDDNFNISNGMKNAILDEISWSLDGLSFTNRQIKLKEAKQLLNNFRLLDDMYIHSNDWKAFYAPTTNASFNEDQNVLFYNETKKIFTIIHMDHIENGYSDSSIKFLKRKKFLDRVKFFNINYKFIEYTSIEFLDDNIYALFK